MPKHVEYISVLGVEALYTLLRVYPYGTATLHELIHVKAKDMHLWGRLGGSEDLSKCHCMLLSEGFEACALMIADAVLFVVQAMQPAKWGQHRQKLSDAGLASKRAPYAIRALHALWADDGGEPLDVVGRAQDLLDVWTDERATEVHRL